MRQRLTWLVVIYQHDLQSRRFEHIPLATDTHILARFVYHPEIVALLTQDAIEGIPDATTDLESGHFCIAHILAG